jgi:hypothetical protein
MSLAQHVTAEGFDYEGPANPAAPLISRSRAASVARSIQNDPEDPLVLQPILSNLDNKSEWRTVEFNPALVPEAEESRVAAYKVSDTLRIGESQTSAKLLSTMSNIH